MDIANPITILGGLGVGGLLVAFWGQIKSFLVRLMSRVIVNVEVESYLEQTISTYCFHRLKRSPFGIRTYSGTKAFVRPDNRLQVVGFEKIGKSSILFWHGWIPMWIGISSEDKNGESGLSMCFIRGTIDQDKFLLSCIDHYNQMFQQQSQDRYRLHDVTNRSRRNRRIGVTSSEDDEYDPIIDVDYRSYRLLRWALNELGPRKSDKNDPVGDLVLTSAISDAVVEARLWKKSEKWYLDRKIPWKRGWLLHGAPGTGKTSLARALAEELNLPIYSYDLSSISNDDFRQSWRKMLRDVPCIALIEDIDSVFDGRENMVKTDMVTSPLTFDCLLNAIDGIERSDGLFLIITTNRIEKIDPALANQGADISSRPGRIDRVIEMELPDNRGLLQICKRILPKNPELWEKYCDSAVDNKYTVAQLQELCARKALMMYWDNNLSD